MAPSGVNPPHRAHPDGMPLDPALPTPLYFQLKTLLLEEILAGAYGPERRLPTEHELCARLGISRTPVTRALSELAREGVVRRTPRRGTFVDEAWLRASADAATLRAVAPPGPWPRMLQQAAGGEGRLEVVQVERPQLYEVL